MPVIKNYDKHFSVETDYGDGIYLFKSFNEGFDITCKSIARDIYVRVNITQIYEITGFSIEANITKDLNFTFQYGFDTNLSTYKYPIDYVNEKSHDFYLSISILCNRLVIKISSAEACCFSLSIRGENYKKSKYKYMYKF